MPNKKTVKRSQRQRGRRREGGGFLGFFEDKHNTGNEACNPNNLANLKDSNSMHANYQTCCPKNWYGSKNNSPYCKQLDLNYKAASQSRQNDLTVDNLTIDCKTPILYNTKEEMEKYIESCKCDNLSWYNINGKKNCGIVNTKLEKERETLVTNPIQQNNKYMPVNQNDIQYEEEAQEKDTIAPPVNAPPEGDWKQMDYEPDPDPNKKEIDTVGGKKNKTRRKSMKRKTKKYFNKRSVKKRKGRKH